MHKPNFKDNGDETITDTANGLTWLKEDSWQREAKWFTWDEANDYAINLGGIKFVGYNDWRLPAIVEAQTLYDEDKKNLDKYGKKLFLDPIFPEGALPTIWIHEAQLGNEGYILDLRNGEVRTLFKSKSGRMAARPVRRKNLIE